MAVKISSFSSSNFKSIGKNDPVEQADKGSESHSSSASNIGHTDTVSLTGSASQLQQLESRISKMSVVDARLVQEVQRQLATGSFRVNPESAASKLLIMETSLH